MGRECKDQRASFSMSTIDPLSSPICKSTQSDLHTSLSIFFPTEEEFLETMTTLNSPQDNLHTSSPIDTFPRLDHSTPVDPSTSFILTMLTSLSLHHLAWGGKLGQFQVYHYHQAKCCRGWGTPIKALTYLFLFIAMLCNLSLPWHFLLPFDGYLPLCFAHHQLPQSSFEVPNLCELLSFARRLTLRCPSFTTHCFICFHHYVPSCAWDSICLQLDTYLPLWLFHSFIKD